MKKLFGEAYLRMRSYSFKGKIKELGLEIKSYFIDIKNYFMRNMLGKFPHAFEYIFRDGKLPPEAEFKIGQLEEELQSTRKFYERKIEIQEQRHQRKTQELATKYGNELEANDDLYGLKIGDLERKIEQLMISIGEMQHTISSKTIHEKYLIEQIIRLGRVCLSYEAEEQGKKGKKLPYFHLIIKRDDKTSRVCYLNQAAINAFTTNVRLSNSEFLEQNKLTLERAFKTLEIFPTSGVEVNMVIRENKRGLILENIFPYGLSFLAKMKGIHFYRLYDGQKED